MPLLTKLEIQGANQPDAKGLFFGVRQPGCRFSLRGAVTIAKAGAGLPHSKAAA
jgi:hypothetical protein